MQHFCLGECQIPAGDNCNNSKEQAHKLTAQLKLPKTLENIAWWKRLVSYNWDICWAKMYFSFSSEIGLLKNSKQSLPKIGRLCFLTQNILLPLKLFYMPLFQIFQRLGASNANLVRINIAQIHIFYCEISQFFVSMKYYSHFISHISRNTQTLPVQANKCQISVDKLTDKTEQ